MPEAILYITGKPDNAGGPLPGSIYAWKPVCAEGLTVCTCEARRSGRPGDNYTVRSLEAGPCRRPYSMHLGSPTEREAHYQNLDTHGSRSVPEALLCVYGKPDRAGGPVTNTR